MKTMPMLVTVIFLNNLFFIFIICTGIPATYPQGPLKKWHGCIVFFQDFNIMVTPLIKVDMEQVEDEAKQCWSQTITEASDTSDDTLGYTCNRFLFIYCKQGVYTKTMKCP